MGQGDSSLNRDDPGSPDLTVTGNQIIKLSTFSGEVIEADRGVQVGHSHGGAALTAVATTRSRVWAANPLHRCDPPVLLVAKEVFINFRNFKGFLRSHANPMRNH